MTVLLRVSNISKQFGGRQTLDRVSFVVEAGEIVTLIGPNGAGKSTLVRIVLGLMQPDAGRVERLPSMRIGYMPQKLQVDSTLPLSVLDFLRLADGNRDNCLEALTRTRIEHLSQNPVSGLSGGEFQRMLLARAMVRRPDLLVLDEPVQGVDVSGQEALYQLIQQLRLEMACGILMVSHDLHLVMAATDKVICLNQHICCHGSPEQVSVDPAFTELFGTRTALYTHRHDHAHDLSGEVREEIGEAERCGQGSCDHG